MALWRAVNNMRGFLEDRSLELQEQAIRKRVRLLERLAMFCGFMTTVTLAASRLGYRDNIIVILFFVFIALTLVVLVLYFRTKARLRM